MPSKGMDATVAGCISGFAKMTSRNCAGTCICALSLRVIGLGKDGFAREVANDDQVDPKALHSPVLKFPGNIVFDRIGHEVVGAIPIGVVARNGSQGMIRLVQRRHCKFHGLFCLFRFELSEIGKQQNSRKKIESDHTSEDGRGKNEQHPLTKLHKISLRNT
ncbi:MAG: hypothetical protein WAM58_17275 [Candidatus Acidiferrum sp.]